MAFELFGIWPPAQAEGLPDFVGADRGPSALAGQLEYPQILGFQPIVLRHNLDDGLQRIIVRQSLVRFVFLLVGA